ncbi:11573_t:CDS:1 [Funneliformis geosporum]|uniref:14247_t:CDS:1 n=1 Tax=Funneliformis geosporum TaxID=1117311 RepID=A0A9W4WTW2_9GLOM|nr:11573_t:CDS:1 [Funneliformis geosporum]CAI2171823.1 14247_t:CDS:1 [Funneliformis geosporum]
MPENTGLSRSTYYSQLQRNLPMGTFSWKVSSFQQYIKNCGSGDIFYSPRFTIPQLQSTYANTANYENSPHISQWRLKVFPNGNDTYDHISVYLEALQTPYEKRHNIKVRPAKFKLFLEMADLNKNPRKNILIDSDTNHTILEHKFEFDNDESDLGYRRLCPINQLFPDGNKSRDIDLIFNVHFITCEEPLMEESININQNEKFFENGAFADVGFILDCGRVIKAHKIVLASGSAYFDKMLQGGWIEGTAKIIKLHNWKYETFKSILYYIYTHKLVNNDDIELLKEIYINSDMIGLITLQKLAKMRLVQLISFDNWEQILLFGWDHDDLILKTCGLDFVSSNYSKIRNSDAMKRILDTRNIEWIEEIMAVAMIKI